MSIKTNNLEQLILEFLSKVERATTLLEEKFGMRCILGLWRSNKIERCGTITGNITYELHGVGCAVYLPEACIDFDYGTDGRTDGFDVWRLYLLACELPSQYKKYTDKKVLKSEFDEYIAMGKLEKMSPDTNDLYVFKEQRT
ncbi:DUF6896 domain-containing protein [Pseudomonas sp. NFX224]|uniref:DUF6896 domain-containing protein n=1 Tax=Pseudomonas sp. NFX224 TaxID=3402862 RepID=UPI003AFAADB5